VAPLPSLLVAILEPALAMQPTDATIEILQGIRVHP
jgi:hypothetical protein